MVPDPVPHAAAPLAAAHAHEPAGHDRGPGEGHDHHGLAAAAAAIGASARTRRLGATVRLAIFALAALVLAAELGLRWVGARARDLALPDPRWATLANAHVLREISDPVRRYALRPGAQVAVAEVAVAEVAVAEVAVAEVALDGLRFRVSAQGTRGPDLTTPKPASEKRLLCLGDSFAFGLWCDEDETFVAQLAARATQRERELARENTWRALALGVPGYHLGQMLRAFEQDGLALQPDLVLLYANTNDLEHDGFWYDDELGALRRDFLPLPLALKRTLWHWSHLYGWIAARHAHAVEDGPAPELEPRVPWSPVREGNQAEARATLARLAALCRARALPLFVVFQPRLAVRAEARAADWPARTQAEWFADACAEFALPLLDLTGWLRGYADGVDRSATGVAPDCAPEAYFTAPALRAALALGRALAQEAGQDWEDLTWEEQRLYLGPIPGDEATPGMSGAGYAEIAHLAHERLQAQGLLP